MADDARLIERAFPLKQASLDSVHEKNVRHGHISTLHIWPARRPLAASRAALIATLLPDPGTPEARQKLCERIGGKVVQKVEKKKMPGGRTVERIKEETEGGILHWLGSDPTSGGRKKKEEYRRKAKFYEEELEWFRQEIRKAYGGRAPRVLDPFAGGGAIPLEAMRLGCEVMAGDINPVAWFILKSTLEYPQRLAGKTHPLPDFVLEDEEFMAAFYKAHPELIGKTIRTKKQEQEFRDDLFLRTKSNLGHTPQAELAWHVRAWGKWVLACSRKELAQRYPIYADFEPLKAGKAYEKEPMRLVPLKDDSTADIGVLNAEFSAEYLADPKNPRWVAKPAVAYLWARTVTCKNCRRPIPILKTLWLNKRDNDRVLLQVSDDDSAGLVFSIQYGVPVKGGNAAQKREHDRQLGNGTMSKSGAKCLHCPATMTREDLQVEGKSGTLGYCMTAVVVDGQRIREFRIPTEAERQIASTVTESLRSVFDTLPDGIPTEPIQANAKGDTWCVNYGRTDFQKLFTSRQLLALGVFAKNIRSAYPAMKATGIPELEAQAVTGFLYCCLARLADRNSEVCRWQVGSNKIGNTFTRYALPFMWDFCEVMPWADSSGGFLQAVDWVAKVVEHTCEAGRYSSKAEVNGTSAIRQKYRGFDLVVTDPPYYDAVGYGVVMDFFAVWLKRSLSGIADGVTGALAGLGSPKWNHEENDGELVDDAMRQGGDRERSKAVYETGMARAFSAVHQSLNDNGRFVVVFAHKEPDAWETLVSAMIRAGFVVDASWPIMTERAFRMRSIGSAALSSSVWLVCKKRPTSIGAGWDNKVLEEMRENIAARLREFWDAGIRGPDFVWAATGPALEAYSKHPVVKKANDPGRTMEVSEFLSHVRRMVVDFVVGRVLTGSGEGADLAAADRMDAPTAYYLLHRHDFGLEDAPSGACILYATACGLSDRELESTWDVLVRTGSSRSSGNQDEMDEETDPDTETDPDSASESGSRVKLKTWAQRKHKSMGYEAPGGQPVPLIDRIHRLMHLWRAGEVLKVDEYLDDHGLRRQELFRRLLQSLIELSPTGSEERTLLESLSNHIQARGAKRDHTQVRIPYEKEA